MNKPQDTPRRFKINSSIPLDRPLASIDNITHQACIIQRNECVSNLFNIPYMKTKMERPKIEY